MNVLNIKITNHSFVCSGAKTDIQRNEVRQLPAVPELARARGVRTRRSARPALSLQADTTGKLFAAKGNSVGRSLM